MGVGVVNIALRGITMTGRFVLLIALAAYCTPAEVGVFALFTAASQWGVYLQGLEFHLFNLRNLIAADPGTRARRIRDAFALYALVFAGSIVVWLALFAADVLPLRLLGWFLAILALEHAAQESYRLLTAFERPLAGSLVLFARTGLWNYVVAALMWVDPSYRSLDVVWLGWVIGGSSSVVLAIIVVRTLPWRRLPAIDWSWVRRGLAISLPLLLGSLADRGIHLFDRWYVGYLHGETSLGVYGFFASLTLAIPVLAESGVGAVLYPAMMKAWRQGDRDAYRKRFAAMWLSFGAFLLAVIPVAALGYHFLVPHLRGGAYTGELGLFVVLLATAVLATCSAVPQYALWARDQDRSMIAIPIVGLVTAILLDLVLVPRYGAFGAALGQLVAAAVMLGLRVGVLARADRSE
jgi:O-antigen/teichoic acid export membrane protein